MTRRGATLPSRRRTTPSGSHSERPRRPSPVAKSPSRASRFRLETWPEWVWLSLFPVSLLALLWACRGAPIGTAVADDYSFLASLRFHHPPDLFGPMGASYYWRPLSRQLYFSAVSGWLIRWPWLDVALHALLLVALGVVLYRLARRGFTPPVAATIAVFPLLSESTRVVLGWPSSAQHLLPALAVAVALNETLAGRALTASLAALAGLLSGEAAVLVLPALPIAVWFRSRSWPETLRWARFAAAVAAVWGLGYWNALHHGVVFPAGGERGYPWEQVPALFQRVLGATLNLEDLDVTLREDLKWGYAAVLVIGLVLLVRSAVRARIRHRAPALTLALAWGAIGALPLALFLHDWNAWHAWEPTLALGVAFTGFLGLVSPWLAGAFMALRLTALLLAPPAPVPVSSTAPVTTSHLSFPRLARLQRTVESTRRVLIAHYPNLPRGARVRFWAIPRLTEFGFGSGAALKVWYGDSAASFRSVGSDTAHSRFDAVVEYLLDDPWPAVADQMRVFRIYEDGAAELGRGHFRAADSLLALARQIHGWDRGPFLSIIEQNRARVAYLKDDFVRADSINKVCLRLDPNDPNAWATECRLAMIRNDRQAAVLAIARCLKADAAHVEGRQLATVLGVDF